MKLIALLALTLAVNAKDAAKIHIPDGTLKGVTSVDGQVIAFKGIPYAAPPVGDLRWKPPQPVSPWTGVRSAADYGARCMQAPIFSDMIFHDNGPSEDCLHLNVWVPAKSAHRKLPVMLWIFGGGFMAGATSEPRQEGMNLTKKGVIVVSMDYRLGIFGFFAHPDLAKESPRHASGNYGLLDQLAALQWVHKNIAHFGGDPGNVTLFGESAGSFSVSGLVASPLAKNLFQHAIGESGAMFSQALPLTALADAEAEGVKFAGPASLADLRAKPAADLLKASMEQKTIRFSTDVDGYFLPESTFAIYSAGKQSHVPLLAGWNADEGGYNAIFGKDDVTSDNYSAHLKTLYSDNSEAIMKLYSGQSDAEIKRAAGDLAGDRFIAYSTWKWLELQSQTGGSPVYRYEFDQALPGPNATAYHSAEIEFVFGVLENKKLDWRPEDHRVSDLMTSYWTNFARTGDPNGAGLSQWPAYNKETGYQVMHLSAAPSAAPDTHRARYEFLDSLSPYK